MEEIRLQKYLADCGVASRRRAEELMLQGRVTVNDKTADKPGIKITGYDVVKVDGKPIHLPAKKVYMLLNKPPGYLSTVKDEHGRKTVMDLISDEVKERVFPVGRLDYDSEGLLILTNDGEITYALTHPKHNVSKTYVVTLDSVPSITAIDRLKKGVIVDGKRTKPAKVEWLFDNVLQISISEGRNRQIRKMAEAVGYKVVSLKRTSIGMLQLGNIPLGRWRHITKAELQYLKGLVK